jgi:iron complex transport system ATP-binding protein
MIEIKDLSVITADGVTLLCNINLGLRPRAFHAIIGPNGSGKTTLLKAIHGEQKIASGSILIDGWDPHKKPADEVARCISYVEADHVDPFAFTVLDVILWGRWSIHKGYPSKEDIKIATECARQMGLSAILHRSIASVSTGERKKSHLARSLASQCPRLSWDEPCGPLDLSGSLALMQLMKALASRGQTIIQTMHDIALALDFADTLTVLSQGSVKAHGTPHDPNVRKAIEETYGIQLKNLSSFSCATLPG